MREIGNILPKIADSRPNVVPIETKDNPLLPKIRKEDDPTFKVKVVAPEEIIVLTRAQRQVNFDVAALNREEEKEQLRVETITGEVEEAEVFDEGEIAGLGFEEEDYD